jgi:putative CocE/NonD family hydrolase
MYANSGAGTASTTTATRTRRLPLHSRLLSRRTDPRLARPVCDAAVDPALPIRMSDGVVVRADHDVPLLDSPAPTVLVRTPYGRGFPWGHLFGTNLSRQGLHVVLASCRGTGGSGGYWRPFHDEEQDGQDAVAWLREQPWFDGRLATIGTSYLGHTQLALAAARIPEWRAAVLLSPAARPAAAAWSGGVFMLDGALVTGLARLQGTASFPAYLAASLRLLWGSRRLARELPLLDRYPRALGGRSDVFEGFLTHPDPDDPFWDGTDQRHRAPDLPPTLVVGGWWDQLLDQTLDVYDRRAATGPTSLLVGPWTHTTMVDTGWPQVFPAALAFLREHLAADPPAGVPSAPQVRVHVGGAGGGWRTLPAWPPPALPVEWVLTPGGGLTRRAAGLGPPPAGPASTIDYDPGDPTPSTGGATISRRRAVVDNAAVEARADVLLFTSPVLPEEVTVVGQVAARLALRVDGTSADAYVRLCDVDPRGVSRNVCDGILRLDGHRGVFGADGGVVTVDLGTTAHRFAPGHRIRVQVAGGSHPRFARNTGTGEPVATATRLAPARLHVRHEPAQPSVLVLPTERAGDA